MAHWNMAPSEFWKLHPDEFWLIVEARRPQKMYGSMTESEVAALYDEMVELGVLT